MRESKKLNDFLFRLFMSASYRSNLVQDLPVKDPTDF